MKIKTNVFFKIFLILAAFLLILEIEEAQKNFLVWITLILNIYMVFRARKSWLSLIICFFIAYSNYSILAANYIFNFDSYYTSWSNEPVSFEALKILFLFTLVIAVFFPYPNRKILLSFNNNDKHNSTIVLVDVILLVLILIFGFTRPDISGERGKPSTIYEYSIILFIIGFYYAKLKVERITLSLILIMFAFQNIIYGGRVTALQLLLCLFLCFFSDKISILKIAPAVIFLFGIFVAVGNLRGNFSLNLENWHNAVLSSFDRAFALDTAYSSYFTSMTFIKTIYMSDWSLRINMFFRWVASIILGGSAIPSANLADYTRKFFTHTYGGVLPYFGMFYFGYAGVFALTLYVIWLAKKLIVKIDSASGFKKCACVYFVSTVPRWYLYSPSPIFRGLLILFVVYMICKIFNNIKIRQTKLR